MGYQLILVGQAVAVAVAALRLTLVAGAQQ